MREVANFVKSLTERIHYIIDSNEAFKIFFVIGNNSSDMDSVVSSMLYSFMKNYEIGLINCPSENEIEYNINSLDGKTQNSIYIPVINCPKGELFWRLDIAELMQKMGLLEYDFFYFSDCFDEKNKTVFFSKLLNPYIKHEYKIIMMDHHELDSTQSFLGSYVSEIVDHHPHSNDEYLKPDMNGEIKKNPKYYDISSNYPILKKDEIPNDKEPKIKHKKEFTNIEFPRASNMCLILESILNNEKLSGYFKELISKPYNYYEFLIGVIIIDSENFNEKSEYKTEKDKDAKWVQKDLNLAKYILDLTKNSLFNDVDNDNLDKNDNQENDIYKKTFKKLKKDLIDVKYDKNKNLLLGTKALLQKDRKNYDIEHNDDKIKVSFHSVPISIKKILEYEDENTKHKIKHEKMSNILWELADEDEIHVMVMLSRHKDDESNDKNQYLNPEVSLISIYLKTKGFFTEKNIVEFLEKIWNDKTKLKIESQKVNPINKRYKDFLIQLEVEAKINRKALYPDFKEFFENISKLSK